MQYVIIRLPAVSLATGYSKSHIWRLVAQGRFPKPVPLGPNSSGWVEAEVQAWIAGRIAKRDAVSKQPNAA